MRKQTFPYKLEIRENRRVISTQMLEDPFIVCRVVVGGWRNALRVLLGRHEIVVSVTGAHRRVYRVLMHDVDWEKELAAGDFEDQLYDLEGAQEQTPS